MTSHKEDKCLLNLSLVLYNDILSTCADLCPESLTRLTGKGCTIALPHNLLAASSLGLLYEQC